MNKKLLVGTAALTTVAVGGYLYYRWVRSEPLDLFLEDETEDGDFRLEVHPRKMSPEERHAHLRKEAVGETTTSNPEPSPTSG